MYEYNAAAPERTDIPNSADKASWNFSEMVERQLTLKKKKKSIYVSTTTNSPMLSRTDSFEFLGMTICKELAGLDVYH